MRSRNPDRQAPPAKPQQERVRVPYLYGREWPHLDLLGKALCQEHSKYLQRVEQEVIISVDLNFSSVKPLP